MAGSRKGVVGVERSRCDSQILQEEPCALLTHCYSHPLSLSIGDSIKYVQFLQSSSREWFLLTNC